MEYGEGVQTIKKLIKPERAGEIMALGWCWSKACNMLDEGIDPRDYEIPQLLSDFDKDMKE